MKQFFSIVVFVCLVTIGYSQNVFQSNFTGVVVPKCMASGTNTRFAVMFSATVSGIDQNTTYRHFVQSVFSADIVGNNPCAGNTIFPSIVLGNTSGTALFRPALNPCNTEITFSTTSGSNNSSFYQGTTTI